MRLQIQKKKICQYDGECYRLNPSHFRDCKHPNRDSYEMFVKSLVKGNDEISDENRDLIEKYKKTKGVSDQVHTRILLENGWTQEEFNEGSKGKIKKSKKDKGKKHKRKRSVSDD